jgi:NitT/TauT family transport system permease protein
VASDQLVWRPLLAWADKFKIELTESGRPTTSWVYTLRRGAYVFTWFDEKVRQPVTDALSKNSIPVPAQATKLRKRHRRLIWRSVGIFASLWVASEVLSGLLAAVQVLHGALFVELVLHVIWLGFLTLLRVAHSTYRGLNSEVFELISAQFSDHPSATSHA